MSHNHFTIAFPLKPSAGSKVLAEQLPPLMPGFFKVQDSIGTIHYSRFAFLSEKTLLFLGDFDGEFGPLIAELAKSAGPLFDVILQNVEGSPALPVADNVESFTEWIADQLVHALN